MLFSIALLVAYVRNEGDSTFSRDTNLVNAPHFAPAPRYVRIGVQRFDEVVLGALDADHRDFDLGQHRPGIDVR